MRWQAVTYDNNGREVHRSVKCLTREDAHKWAQTDIRNSAVAKTFEIFQVD